MSALARRGGGDNPLSMVQQYYNRLMQAHSTETPHTVMHEGMAAIRQGGESLVVGGLLGLLQSELKEGLDPRGVPIDGLLAIGGLAGAALFAESEFAPDMRNAGAAALSIYSYRQTMKFLNEKRIAKAKAQIAGELEDATANVAGETDDSDMGAEDPILEAARNLG